MGGGCADLRRRGFSSDPRRDARGPGERAPRRARLRERGAPLAPRRVPGSGAGKPRAARRRGAERGLRAAGLGWGAAGSASRGWRQPRSGALPLPLCDWTRPGGIHGARSQWMPAAAREPAAAATGGCGEQLANPRAARPDPGDARGPRGVQQVSGVAHSQAHGDAGARMSVRPAKPLQQLARSLQAVRTPLTL